MANKFIGSGILFPIELNSNGRPEYVNDTRLIECSIRQHLYWPKNIRFFNESFGSRIDELLQEPNDSIAKSLLKTFVKDALSQEKRIIVSDAVVIGHDQYKVTIKIVYKLRTSKIEETFIFPYYKQIA